MPGGDWTFLYEWPKLVFIGCVVIAVLVALSRDDRTKK